MQNPITSQLKIKCQKKNEVCGGKLKMKVYEWRKKKAKEPETEGKEKGEGGFRPLSKGTLKLLVEVCGIGSCSIYLV